MNASTTTKAAPCGQSDPSNVISSPIGTKGHQLQMTVTGNIVTLKCLRADGSQAWALTREYVADGAK